MNLKERLEVENRIARRSEEANLALDQREKMLLKIAEMQPFNLVEAFFDANSIGEAFKASSWDVLREVEVLTSIADDKEQDAKVRMMALKELRTRAMDALKMSGGIVEMTLRNTNTSDSGDVTSELRAIQRVQDSAAHMQAIRDDLHSRRVVDNREVNGRTNGSTANSTTDQGSGPTGLNSRHGGNPKSPPVSEENGEPIEGVGGDRGGSPSGGHPEERIGERDQRDGSEKHQGSNGQGRSRLARSDILEILQKRSKLEEGTQDSRIEDGRSGGGGNPRPDQDAGHLG